MWGHCSTWSMGVSSLAGETAGQVAGGQGGGIGREGVHVHWQRGAKDRWQPPCEFSSVTRIFVAILPDLAILPAKDSLVRVVAGRGAKRPCSPEQTGAAAVAGLT